MRLTRIILLPVVILFSTFAGADLVPGLQCHDYQEGLVRTGFLQATVVGDQPCITGTQTCLNGMWMGPWLYENCLQMNKSCDGQPHGTVVHGFLEPYAYAGMECIPATRLCNNGVWEGPAFMYPSCFKEP